MRQSGIIRNSTQLLNKSNKSVTMEEETDEDYNNIFSLISHKYNCTLITHKPPRTPMHFCKTSPSQTASKARCQTKATRNKKKKSANNTSKKWSNSITTSVSATNAKSSNPPEPITAVSAPIAFSKWITSIFFLLLPLQLRVDQLLHWTEKL